MPLNNLQRLMTAELQDAVLTGSPLPNNLAEVGGVIGDFAQTTGAALLNQAVNLGGMGVRQVLDVLGSGDFVSIIGLVTGAIKRVVGNLEKAQDQTLMNYLTARVMYLSSQAGVRMMPDMPTVGCSGDGAKAAGGGAGSYRFVRGGNGQEDRCVPYIDPLGYTLGPTAGTFDIAAQFGLPGFLRPYGWPMFPDNADNAFTQQYMQANIKSRNANSYGWGVGYSFPDYCTSWSLLALDGGKQDCGDYRFAAGKEGSAMPRLSICWPWCWPLTSPLRMAGKYSRHSPDGVAAEMMAARLYLLPTPQHLQARMLDVLESERVALAAMQAYYPDAYQAEPGLWVRGPNAVTPVFGEPGGNYVRPLFGALAGALANIRAFKRTRSIIASNLAFLPAEMRPFLGSDFPGGATRGDVPQTQWKPGNLPGAVQWDVENEL